MDELLREKIRTYGAIAVIMIIFMFAVLVFMQFKEKSVAALKLKIVNTEIIQALTIATRDGGQPSMWGLRVGYKNADVLSRRFFSYFRIDKNCVFSPNGCFISKNYKSIKQHETKMNIHGLPAITIRNGASIAVEANGECKQANETCATIFVDINGIDGPNALGKDLFVFIIRNNQSSPFVPFGEGNTKQKLKTDSKYGCNRTAELALYCSELIKQNGWKIGADYPW